jgi:hypothetical protein
MLMMMVFWVVAPCGLVSRYQRFGGIDCLLLQVFSPEEDGSKQNKE